MTDFRSLFLVSVYSPRYKMMSRYFYSLKRANSQVFYLSITQCANFSKLCYSEPECFLSPLQKFKEGTVSSATSACHTLYVYNYWSRVPQSGHESTRLAPSFSITVVKSGKITWNSCDSSRKALFLPGTGRRMSHSPTLGEMSPRFHPELEKCQ